MFAKIINHLQDFNMVKIESRPRTIILKAQNDLHYKRLALIGSESYSGMRNWCLSA